MKLNEKLDFLMKVTGTPNNMLGKYLTFDASYISRIRTGKRNPPGDPQFTEKTAEFFSDHILDAYQKQIVGDFICPEQEWPEDREKARILLQNWLTRSDAGSLNSILSDISAVKPMEVSPAEAAGNQTEDPETSRFLYGNAGKREAVIQFLTEIISAEKPPRLLLYSNEEFDWLYEDPEFAKQWASLLMQYIKKGGRIIISHTISRASGEMLTALQKWIPIYMTGAIEPYYYPKILDRVFRKTIFIAEDFSAIAASSVGEHTRGAINCLIHDRQAVASLQQEYAEFLKLCRPLMQIFNVAGQDRFQEVLTKFNENCENMITVRTTPSFYTMPQTVAKSMTRRLDGSWLMKRQETASRAFDEMMAQGNTLTEVLNLPAAEEIRNDKIPFVTCDLFNRTDLFYTAEEFAEHLDSMIEKLKANPGYRVVLSSAIPANELVYVKEDVGVILVKTDLPSIAFAINEQRLVSSFWDYLDGLAQMGGSKKETIIQLEKLREAL